MPRKKRSSTPRNAMVKVTTAPPVTTRRCKPTKPRKTKPPMSTAAWIGYILAGVVVGTGLAVFAVRYRLLDPDYLQLQFNETRGQEIANSAIGTPLPQQ